MNLNNKPYLNQTARQLNNESKTSQDNLSNGNSPLKGKKALISGAGKGIGRSIALAFAENGADLCLVARTQSEIDAVAAEIRSKLNSSVYALSGDVGSPKGNLIAGQAITLLGGIDILVCAAGYPFLAELWNKPMHELGESDFQAILEVDLFGSFRLAKGVLPQMIQKKRGVVILFSSSPAISSYDKGAPYTITKSAVRGLSKEIAAEYGKYNIRSYAIAPGNIKTKATFDNVSPEEQEELARESPMKRWGEPSEIAGVCVALASDNFSFVNGQTIVVDGGTIML